MDSARMRRIGGDLGHRVVALSSQAMLVPGAQVLCLAVSRTIHLLIRDPGSSAQVVVTSQRQIKSVSLVKGA